ncbi:hypothetical protein DERF_008639 [Dermatophagoides farinae]|uniref:Uncharacterized protein n=1 Tax=Dermatophagoides farinae TaxID=6954 RepID=A0A922L4Z4_DERFA|nr:hypothetical protein DERF_008639 [Dermatophagoides farinae]
MQINNFSSIRKFYLPEMNERKKNEEKKFKFHHTVLSDRILIEIFPVRYKQTMMLRKDTVFGWLAGWLVGWFSMTFSTIVVVVAAVEMASSVAKMVDSKLLVSPKTLHHYLAQ